MPHHLPNSRSPTNRTRYADDAGDFREAFAGVVSETWGSGTYADQLVSVACQWYGLRSRLTRQLACLDHELRGRGSSLSVRDRMAAELAAAEAALRRCVSAARGVEPCPAPPGKTGTPKT